MSLWPWGYSTCVGGEDKETSSVSQSVSPPGHVMWFFMQGHLQHPVSPVGFLKASEVGGEQRGELEGQTRVWPWKP